MFSEHLQHDQSHLPRRKTDPLATYSGDGGGFLSVNTRDAHDIGDREHREEPDFDSLFYASGISSWMADEDSGIDSFRSHK